MTFKIDPTTFKAYDIRGIVPTQINSAAAQQVARAFAHKLQAKSAIIGRDVRLTGEEFKNEVIAGLIKSGADVVDVDIVSTDEFYFACMQQNLPGIMVTASHNPPEYNGFKMVEKIPNFVLAKEFLPNVVDQTYPDVKNIGTVTKKTVTNDFVAEMLKLVPPTSIKPLKVVFDTSNGALGRVWDLLEEHLPVEMVKICFEADGNFPNHGNDIVQLENQEMLRTKVKEVGADMGLIFDPDGDRCLLVDDRGVSVPGAWITALLATEELKKKPGASILYDLRSSDAVPDIIKENGGVPHIFKPGHAYIKQEMITNGIPFGGETSGHYYFKDFGFCDSGVLTGLILMAYVSSLEIPLSEVIKKFEQKYILSEEINSKVSDPRAVMSKIESIYSDAEISHISGVAIRYPDWHCVVRPSDNEPLVRLNVEAKSKELMEQKRDELLLIIRAS